MSTNYIARYNICECCDRYDELHIGTSSHGWTFTFHAVSENNDGGSIKSYKEWLEFFKSKKVKIYNEYGDRVSIKRFKDMVKKNVKVETTPNIVSIVVTWTQHEHSLMIKDTV